MWLAGADPGVVHWVRTVANILVYLNLRIPYFVLSTQQRLLISNHCVRYLRAYAVRQNDLPLCNRFFFSLLSAISGLSFRHSLTRFLPTANLLTAPLLLTLYVEPRPQSSNNYY